MIDPLPIGKLADFCYDDWERNIMDNPYCDNFIPARTECAFSFDDLYKAAFGKDPDPALKASLTSLPQEKINEAVREWAKMAGWQTRQRKGTDGKDYTAFAPAFPGE